MARSTRLLAGLFVSLQLMCSAAYADDAANNSGEEVYTEHNYVVNVHFSNVAYGQAVEKVVAHLGVAVSDFDADSETYTEYWQDTKNLDLQPSNTGFVGSLLLRYRQPKDSLSELRGPVVQYEYWFRDGSKRSTEVFDIPLIWETSYPSLSAQDKQALLSSFFDRFLLNEREEIFATEAALFKIDEVGIRDYYWF